MKPDALSKAPIILLDPEKIGLGINVREKTGSVVNLRDSIAELGLIHPILVTDREDLCEKFDRPHILVAGGRRLAAYKLLKDRPKIPARIVPKIQVDEIIRLQHDENEEREDLDAWERSKARLSAVRDEFDRLLAGEPEDRREKLRRDVDKEGSGGDNRANSARGLLQEARRRVGVDKDTSIRDAKIDRIVRKYPELERWGQRPLLKAATIIDELPPEERPALRAFAASFTPKAAPDAIEAIESLATRWPVTERERLLKHLKTDPASVQAKAFGAPPVPDDRLLAAGVLLDELKKFLSQYRKRDEAQEEFTLAFKHFEAGYKTLRHAFDLVRKEFDTFNHN